MSRRTLLNSEICSFFRLYAEGRSVLEIAKLTRCNRNTVRNHLAGRYGYPAEVADKVRSIRRRWAREPEPKLPTPSGFLTLDDTCFLIPSRPCWQTVLTYFQSGKIRSEKQSGKYFTRPEWVQAFVQKYFGELPEGIAIYRKHSPMLLEDHPTARYWTALPRGLRVGLSTNHRTHQIFTNMLWEVHAAAQEAFILPRWNCAAVQSASALLARCQDQAFILLTPRDLRG